MDERHERGKPAAGESALRTLVEVEFRIEADLRRARADAEERLAAAQEEARRIGGGFEAALVREEAALRVVLEREYEAARAEAQARSAAAAARYRGVAAGVIAALGRSVAARVAGSEDPA